GIGTMLGLFAGVPLGCALGLASYVITARRSASDAARTLRWLAVVLVTIGAAFTAHQYLQTPRSGSLLITQALTPSLCAVVFTWFAMGAALRAALVPRRRGPVALS